MIRIPEKKLCCGCHGCASVCPQKCIEMIQDTEGFCYPKVDEKICIDCGLCERVCPILNAKPERQDRTPDAYAAMNLDDQIRERSSSGGVFTSLARWVILQGGVVFGAAWSADFKKVEHIGVSREEDLAKLRGSKYLQSVIGNCYVQVKQNLERGIPVLFSGTPCQAEGLRCFLGKEYENLLCVDFICHGVPSPEVWRKYLKECTMNVDSDVVSIDFRDKCVNWRTFSLTFQFENGKKISRSLSEDPYIRAFLKNACLRPSCYECCFKKINRESDLTLADFWGIEEVDSKLDDNRGTSLIFVHSQLGKQMMDQIRHEILVQSVELNCVIPLNPAVVESARKHKNYRKFLKALETMSIEEAVTKWLPPSISLKERAYLLLQKLGLLKIVKAILGKE